MPIVHDNPERPDPGFAELYAKLAEARDLEPWLSWARDAEGPVLYLGVGAGRLALPLERAGVRLVGVDAHPGMLAALAALGPEMKLVQARIEDLDLSERFSLVIAPSNILYSQQRLRGAARHLARDGRVGIELANPHWLHSGLQPGVRVIELGSEKAWIEVDYEGGYTQQAAFDLVWPEAVEDWLATAGLSLISLQGRGESLEDSSSFHILARRRQGSTLG